MPAGWRRAWGSELAEAVLSEVSDQWFATVTTALAANEYQTVLRGAWMMVWWLWDRLELLERPGLRDDLRRMLSAAFNRAIARLLRVRQPMSTGGDLAALADLLDHLLKVANLLQQDSFDLTALRAALQPLCGPSSAGRRDGPAMSQVRSETAVEWPIRLLAQAIQMGESRQPWLLVIDTAVLAEHPATGRALLDFFDRLLAADAALGPRLYLIGPGAAQYSDHPSLRGAAETTEAAAPAISGLAPPTLWYLAGATAVERFAKAYQRQPNGRVSKIISIAPDIPLELLLVLCARQWLPRELLEPLDVKFGDLAGHLLQLASA